MLPNVSEIRTQGHPAQAIVSGTKGLTFTPTALFVADTTNGQVDSECARQFFRYALRDLPISPVQGSLDFWMLFQNPSK